ncbi:MAG: hypothetical protein M3383_03825 [Actinomycetota bacterium]|nr:hypothetical protein [Actinomycetota bacterium]
MDSRKLPALFALVGVAVAVVLFLLLKDDTADKDTELSRKAAPQGQQAGLKAPADEPKIPMIEIKDGEPVGGVQKLEFPSGQKAVFEITSDVADELHLHGYDRYVDVLAGTPLEFFFEADIEGVFELESHTTGVLIAEISVVPN